MSLQILGKAYAVLSDEEQRALYDEQGTVDEEGEALRDEWDWQEYWRLLFKKVRAGPGSGKGLTSAGANPNGKGNPAASGLSPSVPYELCVQHWRGRGLCCL